MVVHKAIEPIPDDGAPGAAHSTDHAGSLLRSLAALWSGDGAKRTGSRGSRDCGHQLPPRGVHQWPVPGSVSHPCALPCTARRPAPGPGAV